MLKKGARRVGGFLAGAPEYVSVAGICDKSARCEWAAKDGAAPGSSRDQETASLPSVPGRKIVICHGNEGIAAFVWTSSPYVWMVALPVCCADGGQPTTWQLRSWASFSLMLRSPCTTLAVCKWILVDISCTCIHRKATLSWQNDAKWV